MKTARFNHAGGPIQIRVVGGFAQPGAYEVFLWEADRNSRRSIGVGDFINSDDDAYDIPVAPGNDGRIIQCIATVNPVTIGGRFGAGLIVSQDGTEIGREYVEGSSELPTATVVLYIQLEEQE